MPAEVEVEKEEVAPPSLSSSRTVEAMRVGEENKIKEKKKKKREKRIKVFSSVF